MFPLILFFRLFLWQVMLPFPDTRLLRLAPAQPCLKITSSLSAVNPQLIQAYRL